MLSIQLALRLEAQSKWHSRWFKFV